jgi:hypothetical protein
MSSEEVVQRTFDNMLNTQLYDVCLEGSPRASLMSVVVIIVGGTVAVVSVGGKKKVSKHMQYE